MSKAEAKEMFKHVYNEKPVDFKNAFDTALYVRVGEKIDAIKQDIIDDLNSKLKPQEQTDKD